MSDSVKTERRGKVMELTLVGGEERSPLSATHLYVGRHAGRTAGVRRETRTGVERTLNHAEV